jgi:hypothetical protein
MRKTIQVSLLLLAITYSVRAGDIPYGIAAPPPPTSAAGEIQNLVTTQVTAATIALELLQGLVSLA